MGVGVSCAKETKGANANAQNAVMLSEVKNLTDLTNARFFASPRMDMTSMSLQKSMHFFGQLWPDAFRGGDFFHTRATQSFHRTETTQQNDFSGSDLRPGNHPECFRQYASSLKAGDRCWRTDALHRECAEADAARLNPAATATATHGPADKFPRTLLPNR